MSRLAGVLVLALTIAPASALGASPFRAAMRALLEVSTMGVEVRITPVDLRHYRERLLPAYEAAESGKDYEEFSELLRGGLASAPERRPERPDSPWDHPGIERRFEEAEAARKRGDRRPWRELLELLDAARRPPAPALTKRDIARALATLESEAASAPEKARVVRDIGPDLVELLCLPWGRLPDPWFNLTRSDLTDVFRRRSEKLDTMLFVTGLTGGRLEIAPAESTAVLSRADLQRVIEELSKIPRPEEAHLAREHDHFRELVDFANSNPDFALVVMSY